MAKFLQRWFGSGSGSKNSSLRGSQSSLHDTQSRPKTSSSLRTSSSLENLGSYHIIPKELEKNKLHKASWEGNLNKVTRLARPGQINVKDQQQRTPLHLAIVKGHIDIVKYLVQEDARLDVVDNEQRTPLIKAVLSGNQNPTLNYQICKVLMDGGADKYMNAIDKYGRNALHYAIGFGNQNLVKLFLSYDKCDPNLKDREHMTPLHLAIKRNSSHIVQLLLSDQQADPNIVNHNGQTPLHIAASVGYIDIVRLLLISNLDEPCDPTILDSQQLTAYELAKNNHQEACAKLIQEYEKKWLDETPRKTLSISMNEQPSIKANSSISLIPAANLQHEHDETSDDSSSSVSTSKPSKVSPRKIKRASDQWSDDNSQQKPVSHGLNNLFKTNPLQPNETKPTNSNAKKTAPKAQKPQSSSIFGIGPVNERIDSDNTSTSMSSVKPAKQTKPVAINPYVNTVVKPVSNTKSWSDDTITAPVPKAKPVAINPYANTVVKPVSNTKSWSDDTITSPVPKASKTKSDTWDTSPSEDDISISKPKPAPSILQKTQSFTPSNYLPDSDSDMNSFETEIRRLDVKKPTTVENLVNKNVGSGYKVIGISEAQSPLSEDSSWTKSVPVNKQPTSKGVANLIQKPKTDESTWDDSRPLSADLKKSHNSSGLSDLIQRVDTTGVENLTKIMDTIINSNKKQSTSQKVIGKLLVSPMTERTDSESTSREMENEEDYEQSWKKKTEEWSVTSNGHDFKSIRQLPRSTLPHDVNSIRGSISSTKSSFNDIQLNELKENIKRLERTQEDTRDLKRQLKDMENKKNDFEKLYKENDKMLRNIENKLVQEKNEKQRLEMTTKNLNNELKNIKQKLQSLEDEKDLLNQRCIQLKEERDNHDEKLHALQNSSLHSSMTSSFRDDDIDRMKSRHREEMKILSSENDDLHHRTKQLQSDLQLHKESLDVTIRYKIDLEKALEEKTFLQHELDHLKHEKELIEQEKLEYKTKYNSLQEEIRLILLDRSKLEQKLTGELQEHIQEKQRSSDDIRKHQTEIEQLNIKLDDAEARLRVLQTQNETLLLTKDRDIKNEFDSLTQRLNKIEADKSDAEQRYHNEITNKQPHEPLSIHTSVPLSNTITAQHQWSYIQPLNKTFPQSHQQQQNNENYLVENSRQIRSDTERVKSELDRLRQDFDKLVEHYEPTSTIYQHTQLHSQIDTFRQFYEHEFRQRQLLMSKLTSGIKPIPHSHETSPCTACTSSRLLKERLETAIDKSLADERLQTMKQMPAIPRQASALLITNNTPITSVDFLRNRYHV